MGSSDPHKSISSLRGGLVSGAILFFGLACLIELRAAEIDYESANSPSVFRYASYEEKSDDGFAKPFDCVGTFLSPRWAITAAHCLNGTEDLLRILCKSKSDTYAIKDLQLVTQVRHSTHDVLLIEFEQAVCVYSQILVTPEIRANESFFVLSLPINSTSAHKNIQPALRKSLVEISRDVHTINLHDRNDCLSSGDSGTPVFLSGNGSPPMVAGLLIAGDKRCPGNQSFVRLDQFHNWIAHLLAEELANLATQ